MLLTMVYLICLIDKHEALRKREISTLNTLTLADSNFPGFRDFWTNLSQISACKKFIMSFSKIVKVNVCENLVV